MLSFVHGLSLEEYDALLKKQNGLCAICHKPPSLLNVKEMLLHIDHDHGTGKLRGLLCNTCNRAIGLLKDDIEVVLSAAKYLESWQ